MAGRPRGVDDSVILRAVAEVIGKVGPAGLTLAAVADEVGLVPGTLVQRFGSKRGLLVALARQSAHEAEAHHERLRRRRPSSLDALTALAEESMALMDTPERFANHLAFLCMDLTDQELHEYALAVHEAQRRAILALLDEAVAEGELRTGTDTAALAESVQALIAGTGLTWALDRQGTLQERLRRAVTALLSPYTRSKETS
ncbi:transcriptional regulator, TetR family [Microbispora rosea]|uniref:Transcriptional regulator, TetR family n=1 Tax=Microbispora rosea TaxID=58117 RepID=A0A1N7EV39_9ACTN|nr:TetR/AcrR family transcriptional regulator [Microbispora rosea]GIH50442.1 TetR family transcriptional regulator [Microbispora rosea subsp. rosea]SIR91943.1 transcriptional regulator, TetR family [Microbispora rosea]